MPKTNISTLPQMVKSYAVYGIRVEPKDAEDVYGDCPFCRREGKFSIQVETGKWRCLVCNAGTEKDGKVYRGGNLLTFFRLFHEQCNKTRTDYSPLVKDRAFLSDDSLKDWGVVRSYLTDEWLIPGYDPSGKIIQLYRWVRDARTGKKALWAAPNSYHGIMGPYDKGKSKLYFCESAWDGIALSEVLKMSKANENVLVPTGNVSASLFSDTNVLAVSGCGVFHESWPKLFGGKELTFMTQSDHPKMGCPECKKSFSCVTYKKCPNCDRTLIPPRIPPAGIEGAKRVTRLLAVHDTPPTSIHWLRWGEKGYDEKLPSGTDVRDWLTTEGKNSKSNSTLRRQHLTRILSRVEVIPPDWIEGRTDYAQRNGTTEISCIPCHDWKTLVTAWRKSKMRFTEGLDRALSVMLAVVTSTLALGEQLWIKVISPPSGGKTTLAEALSISKRYAVAKSTIRGLHSGYKSDKAGTQDHSLIAEINSKTLIIKDADTLLQAPNLGQILSEFRDLYDTMSRTHYRHGLSRDYENVRATVILCGTSTLRKLDHSELGARFLDCVIMERIDDEEEDEILRRVVLAAKVNMSHQANGRPESTDDPSTIYAKQMTGGYVGYLRANAEKLLGEISESEEQVLKCGRYAKFVAYLRARPSKSQEETTEREAAYRLGVQIVRLATCLAVVLNRKELDEEVMRRTRQVALDTARGVTFDLVRTLHDFGDRGKEVGGIARVLGEGDTRVRTYLRFLKRIGAVEKYEHKDPKKGTGKTRWRLTDRFKLLYEEVVEDDD